MDEGSKPLDRPGHDDIHRFDKLMEIRIGIGIDVQVAEMVWNTEHHGAPTVFGGVLEKTDTFVDLNVPDVVTAIRKAQAPNHDEWLSPMIEVTVRGL